MKKLFLLALIVACMPWNSVNAQESNEVQAPATLFAYPVAPDTIKTFENRVNYIVDNFWGNYDLSKPIADLNAFNGAFRDYLGFLRYCHRTVAISSVRDFLFKAQTNKANFEKIAMLAEMGLYNVGAEYWSDEIYTEFLKAVIGNKQLKQDVRKYYAKQMERINRTQLGASLASVTYTDADGKKVSIADIEADMVMIFITLDSDADQSFQRVRLSTDVAINSILDSGKVKLLCLSPEKYSKEWAHNAKGYAQNWLVGACPELSVEGDYDVRYTPSFIILDKDKNIIQKNVDLEAIKATFGG
ncbi:MAG: DUF5106 domain-containing protein [Muribaculaceae bacterium]|nr:DUF5106 domain-containing protein [Muribaculaceae bacterium]MDD6019809.1 DUF5106 domain-containing protein [bacterium]MDD6026190.1 DUF5106 domain-containing protein [bacterium]